MAATILALSSWRFPVQMHAESRAINSLETEAERTRKCEPMPIRRTEQDRAKPRLFVHESLWPAN